MINDMDKTGIYMIRNKVNGKAYYGSTQNSFKMRKNSHWRDLRGNRHHTNLLQQAWNEYGENAFEFIILEVLEQQRLTYRQFHIVILSVEQEYLDRYWDGGINCYNDAKDTYAPLAGRHRTEETKAKISKGRKGIYCGKKHNWYGIEFTAEHKANISKSKIGNTAFLGHEHTQSAKDKIRAALMGNKNGEGKSPIITHNGKALRFVEWATTYNIATNTLRARLNRGMSFDKALTMPVKKTTIRSIASQLIHDNNQ